MNPAPNRGTWTRLALLVAWLVVAVGLFVWVSKSSSTGLREQLKTLQFWNMEAIVWAFAAASATVASRISRIAERLRMPWRATLSASTLAFALAVFAAPQTNRIYFDEHIYQHIGQNLSDLRLAQMCNEGTVQYGILRCYRGEYNKQPTGYPHLLSVVYRLFGVDERWAFWLNPLCLGALVVVVSLATLLLFEDRRAAGFAALVMALIPEQLRWSHTAAAEPSAALMCAVAVLAALVYVRDRSTVSLAWLVTAAAFAVQFRPEALFCLPIAAAIVTAFARDELTRPRLWIGALVGLVLCAVLIAHMAAVRNEPWGASGERMSLAYLGPNLAVNGWFYLADWRFPSMYTGFALAGLVFAASWRGRLVAFGYFALFWGIFLVFYAGSYNYGADVRYSLMTYPPLAMLAGVGLSSSARISRERMPMALDASAVVTALIVIQFLLYLPYVRSTGQEAWSARADVEAARAFRVAVPPDGIVLTHTPSMFLLWGTNALQMSIAIEPQAGQRLAMQYPGGVYLHWGFWCNVSDPVQTKFCSDTLERYPSQLVLEQRHQSSRFALYRLF